MALIACPDCSTEVSDRAPTCPKCGAPLAAVAPPPTSRTEREFHADGEVSVTTTRVIFPRQTYAMAQISSVRTGKTEPSRGGVILLIVLGALFLTCGGGTLNAADKTAPILMGGLGILLIVGGILLNASLKPTYHVIFSTSGAEQQAFSSQDATRINQIVHAINEAIVARG